MKVRIAFEINGGTVALEVRATGQQVRAQRSMIDVIQLLNSRISPDLLILQEYAGLLKRVLGAEPPPDAAVVVALLGRSISALMALPQRAKVINMQFECDG